MGVSAPDAAAELGTVEARHHPVGDENVDVCALEECPRAVAVRCDEAFVTEPLDNGLDDEPAGGFVVGDEHTHVQASETSSVSAPRTLSNSLVASSRSLGAVPSAAAHSGRAH